MSREDEDQLLDFVRSLGPLQILPATSAGQDFAPVDSFPYASQEEGTRRFWLYYAGSGMPLVTEHDREKDQYFVDEYQSPVLELWRSWSVSGILMPGGLQAEMTYLDPETEDLAKKPLEFRKWVDSIEGWIKRGYRQLGIHIFAGPGALDFREQGGILQGR
jgi:hypothetical protein